MLVQIILFQGPPCVLVPQLQIFCSAIDDKSDPVGGICCNPHCTIVQTNCNYICTMWWRMKLRTFLDTSSLLLFFLQTQTICIFFWTTYFTTQVLVLCIYLWHKFKFACKVFNYNTLVINFCHFYFFRMLSMAKWETWLKCSVCCWHMNMNSDLWICSCIILKLLRIAPLLSFSTLSCSCCSLLVIIVTLS